MNGSLPSQGQESNLFEFHFNPIVSSLQNDEAPVSLFQQPAFQHHSLSYFSESAPTSALQDNNGYSSPQLKPKPSVPYQRKRFKTVAASSFQDQQSSPSCNTAEDDNDDSENPLEDDDDSGDDSDSNNGSVESGKKRGKYKIYSEEEKAKIISFMMKHGIQKTLEIFSSNTHKITKRKLKSWMESQNKVKGIKGRKTNDPNRDQALYEWCLGFNRDYGRAPTRKEATKKALELSADATFQASKGWLDKFSKKFNYEFTPLKIIPPKKKKGEGFESDSGSTVSNSNSSDYEGLSPVFFQAMQQQPQQSSKVPIKGGGKPWTFDNPMMVTEPINNDQDLNGGFKVSSFFNFNPKVTNMEMMNHEKKEMHPSFEGNSYTQGLTGGLNNNMPFGIPNNPMGNGMNNNLGYGFGYSLNYGPSHHSINFQMGHQQNQQSHGNHSMHHEEGFQGVNPLYNGHFYSDINGYLNTGAGAGYENHNNHHHNTNNQMNNHQQQQQQHQSVHHHGQHHHQVFKNNEMKLEHPY